MCATVMAVVLAGVPVDSSARPTTPAFAALLCMPATCHIDSWGACAVRVHVIVVTICPTVRMSSVQEGAGMVVAGVEEGTDDLMHRNTMASVMPWVGKVPPAEGGTVPVAVVPVMSMIADRNQSTILASLHDVSAGHLALHTHPMEMFPSEPEAASADATWAGTHSDGVMLVSIAPAMGIYKVDE